jgi:hypothetical protein
LRIAEGIELADFVLDDRKVAALESLGHVKRQGPRLSATRSGRAILNAVIRELVN